MPGHDSLANEAGALLDVLATRLQTAAERDPAHERERCTGCPICVGLTYLDSHGELSAQLAHGALVIVNALRSYLNVSAASADVPTAEPVQHIDIR
jgi:hypothetical protein